MKERVKSTCEFCGSVRLDAQWCTRIACQKYRTKARSKYEMTFEEIGEVLGLSHERVRQIYEKAMAKLKIRLERLGIT